MILGVLPEQGGSLRNLRQSGQDQRFVSGYLTKYATAFSRVLYFSYAAEDDALPEGCELVANRSGLHRWAYAFSLPFVQAQRFRGCHVLRVMQLTGEIPALLAKLLYGVPFAATYGYHYSEHARADGAGGFRAKLFAVRTRVVLKLADRIIVTNPAIKAEIERQVGAERIAFLPNGVDIKRFAPGQTESTDGPILLFVGRLSPQKNLPLLLEAAARLHPRVVVRMIGTGSMREELVSQAKRLELELQLPGIVAHEDLPEELRRASLFVMTSRIEGHPKALLEAMACGCVCVATHAPGVSELLEHRVTGLLCAAEPDELADHLKLALADQHLRERLSVNARQRVERDFSLDSILSREVEMLKQLASTRRLAIP